MRAKDGVVTGEDESATGEGDDDMAAVDDSNLGRMSGDGRRLRCTYRGKCR